MKCRRLLLPLPLLPTIAEALEDSASQSLPAHLPSSQSSRSSQPSSQSLDDYMSSIQALARPMEAASCGPVRLQRSPKLRLFSKGQLKHPVPASLSRGSPRALRTSCLSVHNPVELSLRTVMERECKGRDPVDWLFGQTSTQMCTSLETC